MKLLAALLLSAFTFFYGVVASSSTVAKECDRLGGFYVEHSTYTCSKTKEAK